MKNLTVISDPGVDDLVALVLLDKLKKNYTKTLVSTYGNNSAELTSKNAQAFTSLMGQGWEFREGARLPLSGRVREKWLDGGQGLNGLWDVKPPYKQKPERGNKVVSGQLISLAPLTEAMKLMETQRVKNLVVMGGLFNDVGENQNPAELNIRLDTQAASWVFENCRQMAVTVIPADAAKDVFWTISDVRSIPETNPTNIWLKKILLTGYKNKRYREGNDFVLYDPVAIYLAFMPEFAEWQQSGIAVTTKGSRKGCTVLCKTNPPCNIAMKVTNPKKLSKKIFDAIFNEDRP